MSRNRHVRVPVNAIDVKQNGGSRCRVFSPRSRFLPMSRQTLTFLRGGLPGARWIDPENYHLTLRFIGDVDATVAHEIASMLDRVNRAAFELRLDGLSSFGGRKPRAVVANVAPSQALMDLQAEHERLMQRVGLEPEGRKYTPHVTLARLRDSSSRQVADYLERARIVPLGAVPRRALRAVFVARLGRRRALCGRGGLSAREPTRGCAAGRLALTRSADLSARASAACRSCRRNRARPRRVRSTASCLRARHQRARQLRRTGSRGSAISVAVAALRAARSGMISTLARRRAVVIGADHDRLRGQTAAGNARRPRGRRCRPRRTGSGRESSRSRCA